MSQTDYEKPKLKWERMLKKGCEAYRESEGQADKFTRRVRRGIPPAIRWKVWCEAVDLETYKSKVLETYGLMGSFDEEGEFSGLIRTDIGRSFPELPEFGTDAQEMLFRVLNKYANMHPDVGYCQGMNFLAGMLLIISNYEEDSSFFLFLYIMDAKSGLGIEGFFREGFPLLRLYLRGFSQLLEHHIPELAVHFEREGVEPALYLHQWCLTLFSNCLPLQTVLVIWDTMICDQGLVIILQIIISLLDVLKSILLAMEFEAIVRFFRGMRCGEESCDAPLIGRLLIKRCGRVQISDELREQLVLDQGSLPHNIAGGVEDRERDERNGFVTRKE